MKPVALLGAAALLAACKPAEPPADSAGNAADVAADANLAIDTTAAAPAPMLLHETSWEFTQDGKPMIVSIDKAGGYVTESADGKHVDHGTYALVDDKDCFTSAMGEKATECYTSTPPIEIGVSAPATDSKGVAYEFKRVAYRPLKTPA